MRSSFQPMYLQPFEINNKLAVSEIVKQDYRTAEVFRRYGLGYCCSGRWPMDITCQIHDIDEKKLRNDLELAIRTIPVSNQLDFSSWSVDFLMDYIINVHHKYLHQALPQIKDQLIDFIKEHVEKFPWLKDLEVKFDLLTKQLLIGMQREEEELFPYIRQITHAHNHKEPYAALLIKTLRKPLEDTMFQSQQLVTEIVFSIRTLTSNYNTPSNVCTNHRVIMQLLKELDNDLSHHLHLEQTLLYPKAKSIEKEVLSA